MALIENYPENYIIPAPPAAAIVSEVVSKPAETMVTPQKPIVKTTTQYDQIVAQIKTAQNTLRDLQNGYIKDPSGKGESRLTTRISQLYESLDNLKSTGEAFYTVTTPASAPIVEVKAPVSKVVSSGLTADDLIAKNLGATDIANIQGIIDRGKAQNLLSQQSNLQPQTQQFDVTHLIAPRTINPKETNTTQTENVNTILINPQGTASAIVAQNEAATSARLTQQSQELSQKSGLEYVKGAATLVGAGALELLQQTAEHPIKTVESTAKFVATPFYEAAKSLVTGKTDFSGTIKQGGELVNFATTEPYRFSGQVLASLGIGEVAGRVATPIVNAALETGRETFFPTGTETALQKGGTAFRYGTIETIGGTALEKQGLFYNPEPNSFPGNTEFVAPKTSNSAETKIGRAHV